MNLELLLKQADENWNERGKDAKHLDIAYFLWNTIVQKDPENRIARTGRAYALYEAENWEGASEDFTKALSLEKPQYSKDELAEHLSGRGVCKAKLNDSEGAITDFEKALEIGHTDHEKVAFIHSWMGCAFYLHKDKTKAEQHYLKSIEISPNSAVCHIEISRFYQGISKHKLVEKHYLKVLELGVPASESVPKLYNELGFIANHTHRHEKAIEYYTKGLAHASEKTDEIVLRNGIGYAFNRLKKYEQAHEALTSSLGKATQESTKRGDTAYIHANLGDAYSGLNNWESARKHYQESLAQISAMDAEMRKICRRAFQRSKKGLLKLGGKA